MFEQFEDKGKSYTQVVTKSPVKVIIQTEKHRIIGLIHVRPDDRIKDALELSEHFLAITDSKIFDSEGKKMIYQSNFLAVNRTQIIWLIPHDELISGK